PAVVTDLRFRRALLHAIDRQEMADTLQGGLAPVANTFMAPNQPDYAGIEPRVMKYDYDPRKAAQMIEELGYRRGSDGMMREHVAHGIAHHAIGSPAVSQLLDHLGSLPGIVVVFHHPRLDAGVVGLVRGHEGVGDRGQAALQRVGHLLAIDRVQEGPPKTQVGD